MLNLDLTNSTVATSSFPNLIADYLEKIHARKQGFYECIDDHSVIEKINTYAATTANKYDHIVILGIGGSALGAICLQQSLTHIFKAPKLHVIDNIDPILIKELEDITELPKTLFIVITKSGTTPETLAQYFYFRDKVDQAKLDPKEHFVFITDPTKGTLREITSKDQIPTFDIPENIGGRFSVLTAVGLLPAKLLGLDIKKLIDGAKSMRDKFLSQNIEENLSYQIATIQNQLAQNGKNITVLMPYAQKLIRFADWYRQLLAESIGKENKGLTPINSLGVTDQHSQSQLYNEGPNDKLIIFIEVENLGPQIKIPHLLPNKELTFNTLLQIEKDATAASLTKNNRPNFTIKLDSVTEESLGELFMLFEGSIAFLGEFYNINAFDQPGVELSKQITKEALAKL